MALTTHYHQLYFMRPDILDEKIDETGPRTCPDCGYRFPFGVFVRRYGAAFGFSKWDCPRCGERLTYDFSKLQMWWFAGLVVTGVAYGFTSRYFDLGIFNLLYMLPYFGFMLVTLYYVEFERVGNE